MSDFQKKINVTFSIARVFAVYSIVAAHIPSPTHDAVYKMVNALGSIGVVVFIILSAYFYNPNKYKNIFKMLKSKIKAIFVPWIFMGSVLYFVNVFGQLRKGVLVYDAFSVKDWLLYLIGHKTFLWYMSILVLCYLIFYVKSKVFCYISIIVTVISVYLTATGIINPVIDTLHLTNYLNILNWIGYFALGRLLREIQTEKLFAILSKTKWISLLIFTLFYGVIVCFNIPTGYFSYVGMPFQIVSAWCILSVSTISAFDKKWIHKISNYTFGIYLLHMIVIGLLDVVYNSFLLTRLFSPLIVVASSIIILEIGLLVSKILHLDAIYAIVTGIRIDRNIKGK